MVGHNLGKSCPRSALHSLNVFLNSNKLPHTYLKKIPLDHYSRNLWSLYFLSWSLNVFQFGIKIINISSQTTYFLSLSWYSSQDVFRTIWIQINFKAVRYRPNGILSSVVKSGQPWTLSIAQTSSTLHFTFHY